MLKEQEFKDRKMASPCQTPVDFTLSSSLLDPLEENFIERLSRATRAAFFYNYAA